MMDNCQNYVQINNVVKKIIVNNYDSFFAKVFSTLHPNCALEHNWHINLISRYLSEIEDGKIRRLIINIPPRFLKSLCISVAWPAWLLAKKPTRKIIVTSYSKELGKKHSQDCRFIMQSEWYTRYFPNSVISGAQNTQNKFTTKSHGFRFATSVNGTLTGEGADFIIVDDPQTPLQALSKCERERTIQWFEQTLVSRLNDRQNGIIVVVMQRLHNDDLSGYLLKKSGWDLLKIPLINKERALYRCAGYSYLRKKNEPLHEKRCNIHSIDQLKKELGDYAFNAQYLQDPLSVESSFVKKSWFKYYDHNLLRADEENITHMSIYQSWDCAIKNEKTSDYTVCITLGHRNGHYYLLDIFREKIEYPSLKNAIIQNYRKFRPEFILIEDKASGQQIVQELKNELPIIPMVPRYDKFTRFVLITPLIESGKLLIPLVASWVSEFEEELLNFPRSKHDDQIDALTQALQWLSSKFNQKSFAKYIGIL